MGKLIMRVGMLDLSGLSDCIKYLVMLAPSGNYTVLDAVLYVLKNLEAGLF